MKLLNTLSAAAISAGFALPAVAGSPMAAPADTVVMAPAPAPIMMGNDWTGGYAGVQLGYGDVSGDVDGYGWLGGVHAGYMRDFGSYVLGLEADYDATDIELGGGPDGIDSVARLKLRAGYDAGPALLYATAGAAHASADIGGVDFSDTGWVAGLGMAYQVNDQWIVGAELLEHQFDDFDGTGVDADVTTATLRASFRF